MNLSQQLADYFQEAGGSFPGGGGSGFFLSVFQWFASPDKGVITWERQVQRICRPSI
jgi:hypothetical protein